MSSACKAFGCVPYVAVVVDAGDIIRGFVTSVDHVKKLRMVSGWRMAKNNLEAYDKDPEIIQFQMKTETRNWWKKPPTIAST